MFNIAVGIDREEKAGIPMAEAGSLMGERAYLDYLAAIEATTTVPELEKTFGEASRAAEKAKDASARGIFVQKKNDHYRTLKAKEAQAQKKAAKP